jgi:hypothetical protein
MPYFAGQTAPSAQRGAWGLSLSVRVQARPRRHVRLSGRACPQALSSRAHPPHPAVRAPVGKLAPKRACGSVAACSSAIACGSASARSSFRSRWTCSTEPLDGVAAILRAEVPHDRSSCQSIPSSGRQAAALRGTAQQVSFVCGGAACTVSHQSQKLQGPAL